METSEAGIVALIAHEGIVPGPYRDSRGVLTYGVGHTKAAGSPDPAKMAAGMPSDLDAELVRVFQVFRADLARYEAAVNAAITVEVEQHQFDAAVSFHYNTGAIGRATWVKHLNNGEVRAAGAAMMNWCKPVELTARRQAERNLFERGVYPDQPLTVWGVTNTREVIWRPQRTLTPNEAIGLMRGGISPDAPSHTEIPNQGIWAALVALFLTIFGGRK